MADAVLIRDATPDDVPAIAAIYRHEVESGLASWEETPPTEVEMAARMAKIHALGLPYLVAERAGAILGYCYAGPYHSRSAYRFTLEDTVYIHQDVRGQGVGRALLDALLARCEAAGCRQVMALIHKTEKSASIALHEKLGFRPVGVANGVGYKFGGWLDLLYMQRSLGKGDSAPPDRSPFTIS